MIQITNSSELIELAHAFYLASECGTCHALMNPGWESVPGSFDLQSLKLIGTLRNEDITETWEEYHPNGTHSWSADAPIAIGYYPYSRCDLYQCIDCSRKYLRYGEYGGYYVDERVRPLNADLIAVLEKPHTPSLK